MNFKKLTAAVTAILCSASTLAFFPELVQQPVAAAEAVANDFETDYEGWYSANTSATLTAVAGMGVGGSRAMVLSDRKSPEDGARSSKGFYLVGGVAYTYNVQVMAIQDQTFHLTVLTKDETTDEVTEQEIAVKNVKGGEWTELSAVYTAPENSYEFELTLTTDSTDNFAFDEVRITSEKPVNIVSAAASEKGLKDAYANYFRVGNILNGGTVKNSAITGTFLKDYNAIECENETKPDATLVKDGSTDTNVKVSLGSCAAICDFAAKNNLAFRGHTLVWHSQSPEWFFKEGFNQSANWVDKNTMKSRMESYIKNMFAAFASQYPSLNLYAYDVCNECVSDDSNRTKNNGGARMPGMPGPNNPASPWVAVYGDNSFVKDAFTFARKYAPKGCKLFYNDYNEYWDHKRDCIYNMCKSLYNEGLLDGVGMQSHINANRDGFSGTSAYVTAMKKYLSIGCDVQISELDITRENGTYSSTDQANKYKDIFQAAVDWNKNPQSKGRVTLVQIWGPNDANTWIKTENAPLLYDTNNNPKEAYNALMKMIPESDWGDYRNPANGGGVEIEPPTEDVNGYWFHQTFENGTEGYESRGGTTVETSTKNHYAGSKSMYISGRTATWNGANYSLPYTFEAGKTYSFSAEVMYDEGINEAEDIYFSIQYTGSDSETHYDKIDTGTVAKGKWMQLSNTAYTIPKDASNVVIYFETPDTTTSIYVDEVIAAKEGVVVEGSGKPKAPNTKQTYLKGDVDGDGVMDVYDLGLAKQGMLKGFESKVAERCADIDENGTVEIADLIQMTKFLLGKITKFEVVEKVGPEFKDLSKEFSNYADAGSWKKEGENNPLTTQRFGADPGWMVYKDRLYLYTTNDAFEYYSDGRLQINTYNSGTINCISSTDLVNWTDHGAIPVAGGQGSGFNGPAKWAVRAWAPDAEWKTIDGKDKFFLYFANNGSGVGVLRGDSPTGPFEDPLGKELANSSVPGGQGVLWQFDPGVYLDHETGEAYLAYGGGVPEGKNSNPGTGRIGKLGADMISIEGGFKAMQTPYLFEDSSLIKIGDTWYYSYCTNWSGGGNVNGVNFGSADICYMTSKDPLNSAWDGSTLQGVAFKNTGSQRIDNGGNNHHSIIYFKGKYYVAYHSRQQALRMGITAIDGGHPNDRSKDSKDGNYRSTQLNEATFSNGKITCNGDMTGIKTQLETLNPYETVGAETMSNQSKGISVQGVGDTQVVAKANEWTKVSGVDFKGTKLVRVRASSKNGAVIRMSIGKVNGDVLSYIQIPAGGTMDEIEAGVSQNLSGVEDVYFSFSGDVTFDSWVVE